MNTEIKKRSGGGIEWRFLATIFVVASPPDQNTPVHQMQMVVNHFQIFCHSYWLADTAVVLLNCFKRAVNVHTGVATVSSSLSVSLPQSLSLFFAAEALAGAAADNPGGES